MAKVTKAFSGAPDGEVHPREFKPGDEVLGALAAVAVSQGWAKEDAAPEEASAAETKKTKGGK